MTTQSSCMTTLTSDGKAITAESTEVSDILVLAGDGSPYADNDKLIIDLGTRNDVNAYLQSNHTAFLGIHMINYDVSDLPTWIAYHSKSEMIRLLLWTILVMDKTN